MQELGFYLEEDDTARACRGARTWQRTKAQEADEADAGIVQARGMETSAGEIVAFTTHELLHPENTELGFV